SAIGAALMSCAIIACPAIRGKLEPVCTRYQSYFNLEQVGQLVDSISVPQRASQPSEQNPERYTQKYAECN
ncbi:MAG: hypothetical protein WA997_01475, partial [Anaerolineales bacterium]